MGNQKTKRFLFRLLCGFFLGVSVIAPGVSGSVMAVMMGIYRDLINIISNPFKNFKRNLFYLLPMGIGAVVSLAVFVKLFAFLFEHYPTPARLLFMGLIAGGLAEVFRQARSVRFKRHYIIGILAAFAIALTVGMLARGGSALETDHLSLWFLCAAGAVAGVSSMVPGMSVSMILMLFGVYDYLLQAASAFTYDLMHTISVILPVGLCFLIGMVLFSNLTKIIFDRFPGLAYYMVFGFMCGTLFAIFPASLPDTAGGWAVCILMFLAGLLISGMFQFLGKKFNAEGPQQTKAENAVQE